MAPEEQSPPSPAQTDLPANKGPRRRSRRGGRRHSRRREPNAAGSTPDATNPGSEPPELNQSNQSAESTADSQPTNEGGQKLPPLRPSVVVRGRDQTRRTEVSEQRERTAELPVHEKGPKSAGISKAIEQVNEIIVDLKHALEEMDDVLETLELAERQKIDDEREIDILQRSLRRLNRPREADDQKHS